MRNATIAAAAAAGGTATAATATPTTIPRGFNDHSQDFMSSNRFHVFLRL